MKRKTLWFMNKKFNQRKSKNTISHFTWYLNSWYLSFRRFRGHPSSTNLRPLFRPHKTIRCLNMQICRIFSKHTGRRIDNLEFRGGVRTP